jgi:hypothetical protein
MHPIFVTNKYTTWYYQIIQSAQNRVVSGYVEVHHIIPKSLEGNDDPSNLVTLYAREHFLCHWLLTKMTAGPAKYKMLAALSCMRRKSNGQQRIYASWQYEICKKANSQKQSMRTGLPSPRKGKKYGTPKNVYTGPQTLWWNNGISEIKSYECPEGWSRGRLSLPYWTNGSETVKTLECPGEGWTRGNHWLKNKKQTQEHIEKRSKTLKGRPTGRAGIPSPTRGVARGPRTTPNPLKGQPKPAGFSQKISQLKKGNKNNLGKRMWTNGTTRKLALACPGPEWSLTSTHRRKKKK